MDQRVRNIIGFMRENLHRTLPLSELANCVQLSESHLRRLFRDQTGESATRYLKRLRLEQARRLLETTYLSVKQISAAVGLRSTSHFVADFKKAYGVTPTRHADRYRKPQHSGATLELDKK